MSGAEELAVRQLIANGKSKTAVERAKELHKAHGTPESEALLVDAYCARIESLMRQNLLLEGNALLGLVRERFPSARGRLECFDTLAAARAGRLDELVQPLNDDGLSADRRAAIEEAVRNEVCDLAALSDCAGLPQEHPLRQAAAALERAFIAVTSGPVTDDDLALPEVSRRGPLAPWKLLVRAIARFHRGESEACLACLDGIQAASAPARLVPALRAILGARTTSPLTHASVALQSLVITDPAALRVALDRLDRRIQGDTDAHVLDGIRTALQDCARLAPELLDRLRQHIFVRCAMAGLEKAKVMPAFGGPVLHDAYFYRLFALGLERSGNLDDIAAACGQWSEFRQAAVREGWFPASGAEAATLYLHMAKVLRRIPRAVLGHLQRQLRKDARSPEEAYYLFPDRLYERACVLDPHPEAYAQWMEWARHSSPAQAESVARAWNKACPNDLDPVLFLMQQTARRGALHTALQCLGQAERIDSVHPEVRRARLRLLALSALQHIQKKKAHLAVEKADRMAALPEARLGDRMALVAALRYMAAAVSGRTEQADAERADIKRLLGDETSTALLIAGVAGASRRGALETLPPVGRLHDSARAALPAAMARVAALAADAQIEKIGLPWTYFAEAARQLPRVSGSLSAAQLQSLAEAGVGANHSQLTYAASAAGLQHGGNSEARFLFLRAQALPRWLLTRRAVCAAAAAELARQQRDTGLVNEALDLIHDPVDAECPPLTLEQAGEVLRREKAEPEFPRGNNRGPDYGDLFAPLLEEDPCECPVCRQARGEAVEEDDEDDEDLDIEAEIEELYNSGQIPPDMPPELMRVIFEKTQQAADSGQSLDDLLNIILGGAGLGRKHRKGRRR